MKEAKREDGDIFAVRSSLFAPGDITLNHEKGFSASACHDEYKVGEAFLSAEAIEKIRRPWDLRMFSFPPIEKKEPTFRVQQTFIQTSIAIRESEWVWESARRSLCSAKTTMPT